MPEITISDDKSRLDISKIHHFLCAESTWAKGIPLDTVRRSIDHSVCFLAYAGLVVT